MYICSNCEYGSKVKVGKCPNCGGFGTFIKSEDSITTKSGKSIIKLQKASQSQNNNRLSYPLSNKEVKGVIGEAFIADGFYLLAGEPGIGKSTFALQIIHDILRGTPDLKWGYFSGEETAQQVMARYTRLYPDHHQVDDFFYATTFESIKDAIQTYGYQFIIVDSIQTIVSQHYDGSPGSAGQVRTCAELLNDLAKEYHVTVIVIGHVTKGGEIAGPKYLEHIVDVVLYVEGDRTGDLRFLRNYKNRFGNADGTGIFEMKSNGLQPIYDPEKMFAGQVRAPGIAWTIGLDNGRPVVVWIETLLTKAYGKFPDRNYVGVNSKRVDMIIAILEKYMGCKLGMMNIFLNIPGEFHLTDSGLDLAIAMAIYSAYNNEILPDKTIWIGELGLTGRISATRSHEKRVSELPKGWTIVDYKSQNDIRGLQ
ncbi:hypothetical protein XF24_00962 [candidate division SR1 bacterium Aalborg_AAW-1]|nr:hypothetical protein XF24_00962 [candidate division SR1 bacterium Aalborg_AAW-1]